MKILPEGKAYAAGRKEDPNLKVEGKKFPWGSITFQSSSASKF